MRKRKQTNKHCRNENGEEMKNTDGRKERETDMKE
jgi:hypothetical protein